MTVPREDLPSRPPRFMDSDDPLVSRSFDGWWERGWALARRCWRQMLVLQGLLALASVALQLAPSYWSNKSTLPPPGGGADAPDVGPLGLFGHLAASMLTTTVTFVQAVLSVLAGIYLALAVAADDQARASARAAVRSALRRLGPATGWSLLAGPLIVLGFIACVLPGVYLGAVFGLLAPVIVFERGRAFRQCFALFHRQLSASVPRMLIIAAVTYGTAVPVAALIGGVGFGLGMSGWEWGAWGPDAVAWAFTLFILLLGAVLQVLAALLTVPLTLVTYADLRARREPLSTERLVADAAA